MRLISPISVCRSVLVATLLVTAACDNSNEPSTPSQITATTGATVNGRAGDTVTVTVRVDASNGHALGNQTVAFSVAAGGGSVTPVSVQTDANGQATTRWALGNVIGTQSLLVAAGSINTTISATTTAGQPRSVSFVAGGGQTAAVGQPVATIPAVIVRDAGNNPVPNVQVFFSSSPGGVVTPATVTTDASGVARVTSWQLGTAVGTDTLSAHVLETGVQNNGAFITALATAGSAARVQAAAGLPTSGVVGTALTGASLPSVIVTDASGNPVSGVAVTFSVAGGGGTLSGPTQTTNAQGIATVGGFTLGQTAGANTIQATVANVGSTTIAITGTAGAAARAEVASGNNQAVSAGQALQVGPSVRVVDQYGNPVAGVAVTFVATRGGGSVLGGTQTTNAQGIATVGGFTLGTIPGTNTLAARVAGLPDVTFTESGLAGTPVLIRKVSGDTMSVVSFRTAAQPFVVQLVDAAGYPVQGQIVTFTPSNTSIGSLSATSVVTDTLGQARATFTANGNLGRNVITATAGSLTPVTFTITTVAASAGSVSVVQGMGQTATVSTAVPINPTVIVRDASGNPVPGTIVYFQSNGQGGASNPVDTTDANGIASGGLWTLGATPGPNYLDVSVSAPNVSGNPIRFVATGRTVPSGSTITQVANTPPATASPGVTVGAAVLVKDAAGKPVPNLTVQFAVASGGGSIVGTTTAAPAYTTITDANGIARVPSWVLGTTAGTNTLTANVLGGGPTTVITVTTQ